MSQTKTLLINYIYYNPVGHCIEALQFAKGFHDANEDIEITVLLNRETPAELAQGCPWVAHTCAVDLQEVYEQGLQASCFSDIPQEWDYVLFNDLAIQENEAGHAMGPNERQFLTWYTHSRQYFVAQAGHSSIWQPHQYPKGLAYNREPQMVLQVPDAAGAFAKQYEHDGPKFAVLLAGSSEPANYPTIDTWLQIIGALIDEYPQAKIYVTGVYKSIAGKSATYSYTREQVQRIFDRFAETVDCYDIGLWNQIALLQECDILISPHSGFGFLAPCVGTPWLALSGREFNEYFFNRQPFYSVLPKCPQHPCFHYGIRQECIARRENGDQVLCMDSVHLLNKIPDIIEGTRLLLSGEWTYEQARRQHTRRFNQHLAGRGIIDDRFFEWPCWWQPHIENLSEKGSDRPPGRSPAAGRTHGLETGLSEFTDRN